MKLTLVSLENFLNTVGVIIIVCSVVYFVVNMVIILIEWYRNRLIK